MRPRLKIAPRPENQNNHGMDRIFSFFAMPVGILICFGPALVVWLREEYITSGQSKPDAENAEKKN